MMGTSMRTSCDEMVSGLDMAVMPRMNNTLNMLLPTTLPKATPVSPLRLARPLTARSGALVP